MITFIGFLIIQESMKRKLIRQGGGGYTIYLPKQWVDGRGLCGGDTVDVEETDTALIIKAQAQAKKRASADIRQIPLQFVKTKLINLYRLGYDEVAVTYATGEERENLLAALERLLGYAIVEETRSGDTTTARVESISEPSLDKYDPILMKLFYLLSEILEAIGKGGEIARLVVEAYRYDSFCRRAISKRIFTQEGIPVFWAFHVQLIHAARDASFLAEQSGKVSKELLAVAHETLLDLRSAYVRKDSRSLLRIYDRRKIALSKEHFGEGDPAAAHHLLNVINNLYLAASPLYSIIEQSPS